VKEEGQALRGRRDLRTDSALQTKAALLGGFSFVGWTPQFSGRRRPLVMRTLKTFCVAPPIMAIVQKY